MRTIYFLIMFSFWGMITFAQPLTGIKAIPGDYPTIQSAIADLNLQGVGSGGVTFAVAAAHNEVFTSPAAGLVTASGTAADPIVFQKTGTGANPVITAGTGTSTSVDGIIKLVGCDYITFDGINLIENTANNTTTKRMEWGYALVKGQNVAPFNGCQHVVIKNCKVVLNNSSPTKGIYTGNHIATATTALTITESSDAHNYCRFFNDTLVDCGEGISLNGYNAAAPYALYDLNNEIGVDGGNVIAGIGGSNGIYAIYQNNLAIANNSITDADASNATLSGVYLNTANGASAIIYNNLITLTNTRSSSPSLYGVRCNSGSNITGSVVRIYNNQIINCVITTTGNSTFTGVDIGSSPDSAFIYNNTITGNLMQGTGSFYGTNTSVTGTPVNLSISSNTIANNQMAGGYGVMYGVRATSSKLSLVSNNVYNLTMPNSSGSSYSAQIIGYFNENSPSFETISQNNFYNFTINGTNTNSATAIYGIYSTTFSSKEISSNLFHGFSSHKGVVGAIQCPRGSTVGIHGNNIYDLNSSAGEDGQISVKGIEMSEISNAYVYNNFISDLKTTSASYSNAIVGICQATGYATHLKLELQFNTVYLNATSTGSDFGSSAFYCANTSSALYFTVLMNNNILVNTSTPNGAGITAAHRRNGTLLQGYLGESNNNCFYAGVPDDSHLLFKSATYSGGYGDFQNMEDYQNWVSPRESLSFSVMPPFVNSTIAPYDLHIASAEANLFESGGAYVTTMPITDDYDADARFPATGYPENPDHPAKAPDVGADEFAGIKLDIYPPEITFVPIENTGSFLEQTLVAVITDDYSGIPVSGIGLPQLYWRIRHGVVGAWDNVQGVSIGNDEYSFTFGAGVTEHDTVDYYIVAQDMAITPNVSTTAYYEGTLSSDPPACVGNVYSLDYYFIFGTLCGTYYVGAGQTYESFSDVVEALNNDTGTCPVTFLLTDDYYSSFSAIVFDDYLWMDATKTVTIKPAPGVTTLVEANVNSAIFNFIGARFFTIDGSNTEGGADRSMTIVNYNGTFSSSVVKLSAGIMSGAQNIVIKNCILKGGSQTSTNYGVYGPNGGYQDITISNNSFQNASTGLGLEGDVSYDVVIENNDFGSPDDALSLGYCGMGFESVDGLTISQNTIQNIKSEEDNAFGIVLGYNVVNTNVSQNLITGIKHSGTYGYGGKGIDIQSGQPASNILIANNVISAISGDGYSDFQDDAIVGIRIMGETDGVRLYYNSVSLSGTIVGSYDESLSAALYIGSFVTDISIQNNIFSNSIFDSEYDAQAYSIYSDAENLAFTISDYNDYFVSGDQGVFGYLGGNQTSLIEWQTALGQDMSSIELNPDFTDAITLIPSGSSPVIGSGVPVVEVTTDFTGLLRSITNPTMGAYEAGVGGSNNMVVNVLLQSLYSEAGAMRKAQNASGDQFSGINADQISIELHDANDYQIVAHSFNNVYLSTTGVASVSLPESLAGEYYVALKHRNSLQVCSANPVLFSGGNISCSFLLPSEVYGGNLIQNDDGYWMVFAGDINQDGAIDGVDMGGVASQAATLSTGYIAEDVNGDGCVDALDMIMIDNNAAASVYSVLP